MAVQYRRVLIQLHTFLTFALFKLDYQFQAQATLPLLVDTNLAVG